MDLRVSRESGGVPSERAPVDAVSAPQAVTFLCCNAIAATAPAPPSSATLTPAGKNSPVAAEVSGPLWPSGSWISAIAPRCARAGCGKAR
jgi:hypothetical protein